jgi:hypothetical protein
MLASAVGLLWLQFVLVGVRVLHMAASLFPSGDRHLSLSSPAKPTNQPSKQASKQPTNQPAN